MKWLRMQIGGWARWTAPFFTAAERAAILGALKVAAYDLKATRGEPLIVLTFWLGLLLMAAWIAEIVWDATAQAWTKTDPEPPVGIGPKAEAISKVLAISLGLGGIVAVASMLTAAIINAIAATAMK